MHTDHVLEKSSGFNVVHIQTGPNLMTSHFLLKSAFYHLLKKNLNKK